MPRARNSCSTTSRSANRSCSGASDATEALVRGNAPLMPAQQAAPHPRDRNNHPDVQNRRTEHPGVFLADHRWKPFTTQRSGQRNQTKKCISAVMDHLGVEFPGLNPLRANNNNLNP